MPSSGLIVRLAALLRVRHAHRNGLGGLAQSVSEMAIQKLLLFIFLIPLDCRCSHASSADLAQIPGATAVLHVLNLHQYSVRVSEI